jgi:hypothetical protein
MGNQLVITIDLRQRAKFQNCYVSTGKNNIVGDVAWFKDAVSKLSITMIQEPR